MLLLAGLLAAVAVALGWATGLLFTRWRRTDRERRHATDELNRRLSELFALQELSYVLSDSLQLERTVEQVVRYAMRFLDARGALVALTGESESDPLRVAAGQGTLAEHVGEQVERGDAGLVARSAGRERLELVRSTAAGPTHLFGDTYSEAAAAVPLRAHGVVVGTLVIADPRGGTFQPDDIRLLSTVATHAAVVLANARFFELVRHAKDQWEATFDALSEGMAVVDDGGRVTRANRALAQMLRIPIEQIIGRDLSAALSDGTTALAELLDAARHGGGRRVGRTRALVLRGDRLGRTLRVTAARMPNPTPDQSLVVLAEDVTEQQAMEAQLIQSEKLATVGQLVSGVAHELNNPLTSIAGLTEFLLEQKELGPADRGHLKVIHEQADRAGSIVRNLLTFARKGPAERAPVDVNGLLRRTLELLAYDLRLKDIEIQTELASVLPDVMGDRHALQQVALNLLTNAVQAVTANAPDRPRVIRLQTWFDGQVFLRVADSGPGISDAVLPHLFTPFFTTKEPGQGTGLGLSITYSIIESHGGHIAAERPPEGGAAFRIELPPASADAVRTAAPPPVERRETGLGNAGGGRRRSILLVDDDPAVRRTVQALFGREGHAVEVARNVTHAFELAAGQPFDLIIADARSAARNAGGGKLFVEELLERTPALKDRILVATGDVRPTVEEALVRLGLRYVRKPFNLRDLRDEAARVWAAGALP